MTKDYNIKYPDEKRNKQLVSKYCDTDHDWEVAEINGKIYEFYLENDYFENNMNDPIKYFNEMLGEDGKEAAERDSYAEILAGLDKDIEDDVRNLGVFHNGLYDFYFEVDDMAYLGMEGFLWYALDGLETDEELENVTLFVDDTRWQLLALNNVFAYYSNLDNGQVIEVDNSIIGDEKAILQEIKDINIGWVEKECTPDARLLSENEVNALMDEVTNKEKEYIFINERIDDLLLETEVVEEIEY